jgi:hypothetical protein
LPKTSNTYSSRQCKKMVIHGKPLGSTFVLWKKKFSVLTLGSDMMTKAGPQQFVGCSHTCASIFCITAKFFFWTQWW